MSPTDGEPGGRHVSTLMLWLAAAAITLVPVSCMLLGLFRLGGLVSEPGLLDDWFSVWAVYGLPVILVLLTVWVTLLRLAAVRIEDDTKRSWVLVALCVAGWLLPSIVLAPALGWNALDNPVLAPWGPATILMYGLPLVTATRYLMNRRQASWIRVVGIAVLASSVGLFVYMLGWQLFNGETD